MQQRTAGLRKRIKELDCHYKISNLFIRANIPISEIFRQVCEIIPDAMQYPETACVKIDMNSVEFKTNGFKLTTCKLYNAIMINNKQMGELIVCYPEKIFAINNEPFLPEEKDMLRSIAECIGKNIERIQGLKELKQTHEELKEAQLQLIQAEKLETIGTLAAGVAHEVKNPLAIIQLGIDYFAKNKDQDNTATSIIQDIQDAIIRADAVIKELLDFSTAKQLQVEIIDLNAVIKESLLLVKHELMKKNINLVSQLDQDLPQVEIDSNKIQQIFINLFMNAIYAMDDKGTLSVKTYQANIEQIANKINLSKTVLHMIGDTCIVVEIEDNGCGISKDKLNQIYDPFFTTKPTGEGTGLGLTVTQNIIRLHRALIDISNKEDGGVRVYLIFRPINPENPVSGTEEINNG